MPRIELIPEVLYQPNDPYHWEVDNLPLQAILERQNLINLALDNVIQDIRDSIGTQGTLSNRLNQSIDADGNLKATAIDSALHSIEEHADSDNFVRMRKDQYEKLDMVSDEATDIKFKVYTNNTDYVDFTSGYLEFHPSTTVTPVVESPNIIKFDFAFPSSSAHQHYYSLNPVPVDIVTPDYINYKVNSPATAYISGSLRVYINGVRLVPDAEVYVPGALVSDAWTLMSYTEDASNGLFELSSAITDQDVIRVDFDLALT